MKDSVHQTNIRSQALIDELSLLQIRYNEVMMENEKNKTDLFAKQAVIEQIYE